MQGGDPHDFVASKSCRESAEGHHVPNAGFLEDIVVEDPASASARQPSEGAQHGAASSEEAPEGAEASETPPGDVGSSELPASDGGASEDLPSDLSGLNISHGAPAEVANEDKDQRSLSTEQVDALLDRCLLQALHTSVKDKDLPMPGSTLWYCFLPWPRCSSWFECLFYCDTLSQ